MKMNFLYCVITLSAISILLDFVQASTDVVEHKNKECSFSVQYCRQQVEEKLFNENEKVYNVTADDISGLCNAKPRRNLATFCLMECQMRQYEWLNNGIFQPDKYVEYIEKSELGHDETYVQAAQEAADTCRKDVYPLGCEGAYVILLCLEIEGNRLEKINLGYGLFQH